MYNHFLTEWNDAAPLFFDNDLAQPPDDASTPWARIFFQPAEKPQISIGKVGRWEQIGTVVVQIFTGIDRRTAEADNLANIAARAFTGRKTSNPVVTFFENRTDPPIDSGNWYQTTVVTRFRYVEVP